MIVKKGRSIRTLRLDNKVQIHFKVGTYRVGKRAAWTGGIVGEARLWAKAQNNVIHSDVTGDHVIVTANIRFCALHFFHGIKKGIFCIVGRAGCSTEHPTR